jgi:hypothetical protein
MLALHPSGTGSLRDVSSIRASLRGRRSTNSTMQRASSRQNRNGYLTDCVRLS